MRNAGRRLGVIRKFSQQIFNSVGALSWRSQHEVVGMRIKLYSEVGKAFFKELSFKW